MVLKIVHNGEFKDIPIKEGEMFVLPARIPHSPQRPKDTIGLVIGLQCENKLLIQKERARKESEKDALRWYCEKCKEIVYEEWFHCTDLGTQLKPVIERYRTKTENRTCKKCGHVNAN